MDERMRINSLLLRAQGSLYVDTRIDRESN